MANESDGSTKYMHATLRGIKVVPAEAIFLSISARNLIWASSQEAE
jgi:hypothetical protein